MDPVTAVGAISSIIAIVNVVSKTVILLRELQARWTTADLTIVNLIVQLNSLKAAFNKISEWISSDLADIPQHYQLVLDLEESITCSRISIEIMNARLSKFDWNAVNTLELSSKIRFVFHDEASKDFQKFMKWQTSALNLLLTACNCKTTSEQKALLEKRKSRQILDQVKDASSSVIELRDTSSFLTAGTRSTKISSKLSMIFPFLDSELMATPVYQRAMRSLLRRTVPRDRKKTTSPFESVSSTQDEVLDKTETSVYSNFTYVNIIMLGGPGSGKEEIFEQMWPINYVEFDNARLQMFKSMIREEIMMDMGFLLSSRQVPLELDKKYTDSFLQGLRSKELHPEHADAIHHLWEQFETEYVLRCLGSVLGLKSIYFFENIYRVGAPDYVPTEIDVRRISYDMTRFDLCPIQKFFDCSGLKNETVAAILHLENCITVFSAINLCSYDVIIPGTPCQTRIREDIASLASIVKDAPSAINVFLFLNNVNLHEKLMKVPLRDWFPEYQGGTDVNNATEHILDHITSNWPEDRGRFFHFSGSPKDPSIIEKFRSALPEQK